MYKTVSGDTWDVIAKKVYDNELLMQPLMTANPTYLDIFVFSAGIELVVPDIDITTESQDTLPPWKRG